MSQTPERHECKKEAVLGAASESSFDSPFRLSLSRWRFPLRVAVTATMSVPVRGRRGGRSRRGGRDG